MKLILLTLSLGCLGLTGCLKNLNEAEFFRKLEIKSPEYYDWLSDHQSEVEASISSYIQNDWDEEIEWITFWGESRYACGEAVVEVDGVNYILVLGEFKMKGNDYSTLYNVWFTPGEEEVFNSFDINYN